MKNEILNENIDIMEISKETENKLKKSKIAQISDLCSTTKTDLLKIGLDKSEIKNIHIGLQLLGVCLKGSI